MYSRVTMSFTLRDFFSPLTMILEKWWTLVQSIRVPHTGVAPDSFLQPDHRIPTRPPPLPKILFLCSSPPGAAAQLAERGVLGERDSLRLEQAGRGGF